MRRAAPRGITLDDWGYPVIDGAPVPRSLEELARRAASVCPTLALRLAVRADAASAGATRSRRSRR